jgi:Tol biopolymer transport system component
MEMDHRQSQVKSGMVKKGWLCAAAVLTAALSLSCSLVTRTLSQPLQILNTGAPAGLIAYSGTDGNIYTIDREGKHPVAITQDANPFPGAGGVVRLYQYPTWAPNGRSLAYIGFKGTSQTDSVANLYAASSDGKKLATAFSSMNDFPFYLFWSPNSRYVTFLSHAREGNELKLHLADAAGGNDQVIGVGQPYYWDWSPDNRAIFVHTGGANADNPDARVAFYELDGSVQKKELSLKPGAFQAPAWSPGGKELVLAAENGAGEGELVLAGRDGKLKRVLAPVHGPVTFGWSPDGARLAYATATQGPSNSLFTRLVLLDPARPDEAKDVSQEIVVAFFWSPDSQKIAYFVPELKQPGKPSQNSSQGTPKIALQLHIYDLTSGDTKQVTVFEPTEAFLQIIPFFDQYQHSGTIWSPDSQELVLPVVDESGNSRIAVVGVDGAQSHPIADGDLAFWSWK